MSSVPGKLHLDSTGRVQGPAHITHNSPFPTRNGSYGGGHTLGVIMHTMVGNLPGTVAVFNESGFDASATFGIGNGADADDGHIHQFGPLDKGWYAWAQRAGNSTYYSIEFADNTHPSNKLTEKQIEAAAQLVELMSRIAGFPLQEANHPGEKGFGVHYMGGAAWGGHSCPQNPDGSGPRAGQRKDILALAKKIRGGEKPKSYRKVADGTQSLNAVARARKTTANYIIKVTEHESEINSKNLAKFKAYVKDGVSKKMPKGLVYYTKNKG